MIEKKKQKDDFLCKEENDNIRTLVGQLLDKKDHI